MTEETVVVKLDDLKESMLDRLDRQDKGIADLKSAVMFRLEAQDAKIDDLKTFVRDQLSLQNETLELQNEKLEVQNEKLEVQNQKLEVQNQKFDDLRSSVATELRAPYKLIEVLSSQFQSLDERMKSLDERMSKIFEVLAANANQSNRDLIRSQSRFVWAVLGAGIMTVLAMAASKVGEFLGL